MDILSDTATIAFVMAYWGTPAAVVIGAIKLWKMRCS